uniref:Uncharacterized protein n=1 Tax=Anopheles merus TaxID=30066 RepID=A0A182V326_ANOME
MMLSAALQCGPASKLGRFALPIRSGAFTLGSDATDGGPAAIKDDASCGGSSTSYHRSSFDECPLEEDVSVPISGPLGWATPDDAAAAAAAAPATCCGPEAPTAAPWRSPAAHAWPEISTCVTTPSGCTWNPSWPIGLRRRLSSSAPHPFVTARSRSITSSCSSRSPVSRMFSVTHSPWW